MKQPHPVAPFLPNVKAVENWFLQHRRDLAWRTNRTAYRVWLSEIMLQQTQVSVVTDYFNRFVARFPDIFDLANASEDEVLSMWSGLGYYSRCRNLHKTAKVIASEYAGKFPSERELLLKLPGIGSYTAGAILAFAFNKAAPVVDGNIARVLSRVYNDDTIFETPPGKKHFEALNLQLALQATHVGTFQEGIMELGATVCNKHAPLCLTCPLQNDCLARKEGTALQLPKKEKKLIRKEMHVVGAIVNDGTHIWLQKRTGKPLFGGLYEPPTIMLEEGENPRDGLIRLLSEYSIKAIDNNKDAVVVTRQLTHRDLFMYGFLMQVSSSKIPQGNRFRHEQLDEIGISQAVKILLQKTLPPSFFKTTK